MYLHCNPATKKSLASTPKNLDCETHVNINIELLASPPITPTVSTPNAVNKKCTRISFYRFGTLLPTVGSCCCNP